MRLWRIRNGLARIRLAVARFIRLCAEELYGGIKKLPLFESLNVGRLLKRSANAAGIQSSRQMLDAEAVSAAKAERPVIFISACENEKKHGGWKYCGGIKELSNVVKLLRLHGYEAYMVTWDGTYEPWLADHQPHLSIPQYLEKLKSVKSVRCVTSLACSDAFIKPARQIYFWDMELASTEHFHFSLLAKLYRKKKIRRVAGISRTIEAWHMANFEKSGTVIPVVMDESIWFPSDNARKEKRVCYLNEGEHTPGYIKQMDAICRGAGLELEFFELRGGEAAIRDGMQSSEVFLGMNPGKDPLWGEGCPLSTLESMMVGCVLVAFDIIGNRELVQSGFNGILVPRKRPDLMAKALIDLYRTPGLMKRYRDNAMNLVQSCHTMEARWPVVCEFLELEGR